MDIVIKAFIGVLFANVILHLIYFAFANKILKMSYKRMLTAAILILAIGGLVGVIVG